LLDKATGKVKSRKFKDKKESFDSAFEWIIKTTSNSPEKMLITIVS
jgi:hypothetical protein